MTTINLTANEAAVLKNLTKFQFMDNGIDTDCLWAEIFAEDVAHYCGVPAASTGGIVASLVTKGFFFFDTELGRDKGIWLTDLARDYHQQLNS